MNARTERMIDNKMWWYLEKQPVWRLNAIIANAKLIKEEKLEARED